MRAARSGVATTDHFLPFHRSARLLPGPVRVPRRPPTAMQFFALVQETPDRLPAAAAVTTGGGDGRTGGAAQFRAGGQPGLRPAGPPPWSTT